MTEPWVSIGVTVVTILSVNLAYFLGYSSGHKRGLDYHRRAGSPAGRSK